MPTSDIATRIESIDLARAKDLTQHILDNWDWMTWNQLLADDGVLYVRLTSVGINRIGDLCVADGDLKAAGREDAKGVLKRIYSEIKRDCCVTTEILSGYDVTLLGSMMHGGLLEPWSIVIYMKFNYDAKISVITIAAVDLQPSIDAIRSAARAGFAIS